MKRARRYICGTIALIIIVCGLLLFRTCHKEGTPQPKVAIPQPQQSETEPQKDTNSSSDESITQNAPSIPSTDGSQLKRLIKNTSAKKVIEYKPEQIVGEWHQGTIHDIYYIDGTGKTWDESDDVTIEEAKTFRWSLKHNTLETDYSLATGGVIPRIVHVAKANTEYLQFRDDFGNNYIYNRVHNNDSIHENEDISQKK